MPIARGEHVSASVDDKIFIIGGRVPNVEDVDHFNEYIDSKSTLLFDTKTSTWHERASAPTARNSAATITFNGKIYVVGGRTTTPTEQGGFQINNSDAVEMYDPKRDEWKVLAPMPSARGGLSAAVVEGAIYIFGGEQWSPVEKVIPNVLRYDITKNRWSKKTKMLTPRHGTSAATIDKKIYVFGGANVPGIGAVNSTEVLVVK
jgi:N-acetylneuraminic acid mutarotase